MTMTDLQKNLQKNRRRPGCQIQSRPVALPDRAHDRPKKSPDHYPETRYLDTDLCR